MFEGSKNDTSINPRCWVAMNFKQSISYALLQSSVRPMYVGGSIDGYLMKVNQNPGNFLVVIAMNNISILGICESSRLFPWRLIGIWHLHFPRLMELTILTLKSWSYWLQQ